MGGRGGGCCGDCPCVRACCEDLGGREGGGSLRLLRWTCKQAPAHGCRLQLGHTLLMCLPCCAAAGLRPPVQAALRCCFFLYLDHRSLAACAQSPAPPRIMYCTLGLGLTRAVPCRCSSSTTLVGCGATSGPRQQRFGLGRSALRRCCLRGRQCRRALSARLRRQCSAALHRPRAACRPTWPCWSAA